MSKVNFFFDQAVITIRNRKALRLFIEFIFKNETRKLGSVNYIFCRDRKVRQINKEFLGHDYFTDIITFELSGKGHAVLADIYISVDRIRDNAVSHGTTLKDELKRVIFHGALHLCGYLDKTTKQKKQMRSREDFYLSKYAG